MEFPKLEFAFELKVQVSSTQEVGVTAMGTRKIVPIMGGSFEGPEIKGIIVPGGYDWQLLRTDGVAEIDGCLAYRDGRLRIF